MQKNDPERHAISDIKALEVLEKQRNGGSANEKRTKISDKVINEQLPENETEDCDERVFHTECYCSLLVREAVDSIAAHSVIASKGHLQDLTSPFPSRPLFQ